jgi:glycine oxidase
MSQSETELLVIGAGLIGLASAWALRRAGRRVRVLDAAAPGAGASGVAAGMLAALCEAPELPPELITDAIESAARWPEFAAELQAASGLSCDLRRDGTLFAAMDRDELVELERAVRVLAARGLAYEPLRVAEVRARAPRLHPRLAGGLWAPNDHHVDAQATVAALVTALGRLDVPIETGARILRLETEPALVAVDEHGRRHRAEQILVAAGAWTAELVAPWRALDLVPVKGQVVVLHGEPLLDCVVRTPRVYLVPRAHGRLVVGASMEEQGFDTRPSAGAVMNLLREAWRALPASQDLFIEALRSGLRPMLPSGVPLLGHVHPQIAVATGHHRHGVLLTPLTAARVAAGMTGGGWG